MISREELRHVARIARIPLTPEEEEEFLEQFREIFDLFKRVEKIPLEKAEFVYSTPNRSELRKDEPAVFEDPDAIVGEFPKRVDRYAKVPRSL